MKEAIKNFPNQLKFEPKIENSENLFKAEKFIVSGMGGSHLAADLLKTWNPYFDLIIHHDYGLPRICENELKNRLTIISSYSGNTEEAIDGFNEAIFKNIPVAVISVGGELLGLAKKFKKPYVQMPDTGIEPRSALGFSMVSLLKVMRKEKELLEIKNSFIDVNKAEKLGKNLAVKLKNYIPVIYASEKNGPIAYNWKIRFNETGKVPSFYNTFPELNHNEMVGFDGENKTKKLTKNFYFIFLKDKDDDKRISLRMDVLKNIYKNKGLLVRVFELEGKNIWGKIFSSLLLADWAAYYTAKQYKLNVQETEIINRFKKIIRQKISSL